MKRILYTACLFSAIAGVLSLPVAVNGQEQPGHHNRETWEAVPAEFAKRQSARWENTEAATRGAAIYERHCIICHGADGRGTGVAAEYLKHPPADLNKHFHKPPHGDGYLYWRVVKGGTVEPFKSIQSEMPAFETLLSNNDRWDVLAFVHQRFHLGQPQPVQNQHAAHGGHHGPKMWASVPPDFTEKLSVRWDAPAAISRGKTLYETHCSTCHGASGRGDGVAAQFLSHAPANLNNHFHEPPKGDGYMFWRVTKGATVEPFLAMNSEMPAFENVLSEEDRWAVLAYVHAFFHQGLFSRQQQ